MSTKEIINWLPFPRTIVIERRLRKIQRLMLAKLRKHRRKALQRASHWYKEQYFLSSAVADVRRGIRHNEDIFLGVGFISFGFAFGMASLSSEILFYVFQSVYAVVTAFQMSIFPLAVVTVTMFAVCVAWSAAALINGVNIALIQGINRKVYRSTIATLRRGLYLATRTTAAWVAFLLAMFIPVAVIGWISMLLVILQHVSFDQIIATAPYLTIVSLIWMLFVMAQYSLMPIIATFEPEKTFRQAFTRSHQLVRGHGRIFTGALYLASTVACTAIYGVALLLNTLFAVDTSIILILGCSLVAIAQSSVLTVLYLKRRRRQK